MVKMNLYSCPSGECVEYAWHFDKDGFQQWTPITTVIHTREDHEQCEGIRRLMDADRQPCNTDPDERGDDREYTAWLANQSGIHQFT